MTKLVHSFTELIFLAIRLEGPKCSVAIDDRNHRYPEPLRLSEVFFNLTNLQVLNLSGNNFTSLPAKIFQRNRKLDIVTMYGNKRNMTRTLPGGLFANLTKLTVVQLNDGLVTLPEDLFRGSSSINTIELERNYLASLPKDIFKGLHSLSVLKLYLNELTSLPDGIFSDTQALTEIDLSENHFITSISRNLFQNLLSLSILDMSKNQLQTIHRASFKSLEKLKIARFSNNLLTLNSSLSLYRDEIWNISPSLFHHCASLEELYLAKNNISEIFTDWTVSSVKLKKLDLRYNRIPHISAEDLQFTSNEIQVDLRYNNITHIYLNTAERLMTFQKVERPVVILVEDNPIACDCDLFDFLRYLEGNMHPYVQNYFHIIPGNLMCQSPEWSMNISVSHLKSTSLKCVVTSPCPTGCTCWAKPFDKACLIDCSYRNLTSIPRNIQCVHEYQLELNLEGNKLTQLVPLTYLGLSNVSISKLLLSGTNISNLPLDVLPSDVEVLELHNNNISKLDLDVLEFMNNSTKLRKITLHENPWTCDCDTRDVVNFMQTEVPRISESSLITCKNKKIPMVKMTATDFCPAETAMIVGISLSVAVIGLLIGMLAALYYRYQEEIKVWLYAHQLCLWFVTEDELDRDKLYDAFISYSHKDEEFVINELVSKLESGPRPFKLCIHFRDWLAGEWILNQIARSVDDSRRTIVVLLPNFLESVWGRMEFRAVHRQALSEGRAGVILVLYGEIGAIDKLDSELKAYLSMNTYVKWGDPWFWDKLRYALPHPPELTRRAIRNQIFEKHQPTIQINGDKKELIYPNNEPATPPTVSTPTVDTIKVFKCDNINELEKDTVEKLNISNSNGILPSEQLILNNSTNKVQCTTV
ncbi:LOW QUALITY PROTEIN: protein toll-like [Lasioglossum baleicum]|uniref:LOW QUALITY PROTEIN: protein toll-like n=1 Tax=Lasioglossum baleicum TaxID=434251 RepID=UPI003FCEC2D2